MRKRIYIPQPIAAAGENYLVAKGYEIFRGSKKTDPESMKKDIAGCEAMILRTAKVDRTILEAGTDLKVVARHGAGYDNLDLEAAKELGIQTTYSPDTTARSVAEFTIAAVFEQAKRLVEMDRMIRENRFQEKGGRKGMDLNGKTLGIVGFGRIGQMTAQMAAVGLGMRVLAYIPRPEGKNIPEYVQKTDWEQLFRESDFVSVHVPGGEKNRNLIGKKEFDMMKPSAYLIQVSRGGVMDEAAFAEAVKEGKIAGGAVDVFESEPPEKENPLFGLENVLLTPHVGSNTEECMDRIALDVAEDVHLVLSGEQPRHPIKG